MMDYDFILSIFMLLSAIIGLFLCLYHYVERPVKVWAYACGFFIAHFLSDYYWAIYSLVLNEEPNTSAFLAYFGWNLCYIFMILIVRLLQSDEEKKYFNVLMLLPIPINVAQFILYLQFGGLYNNIYQNVMCTVLAVMCLQSVLYRYKNRKNTTFPYVQLFFLAYLIFEYGMWTSTCFEYPAEYMNPYYYFVFLASVLNFYICWAVKKSVEDAKIIDNGKEKINSRYRLIIQGMIAFLGIVCTAGGYFFAEKMRERLSFAIHGEVVDGVFDIIAIVLFGVSVIFVVIILVLMIAIRLYYVRQNKKHSSEMEIKGKFNFAFTLTVTFILMVFAVFYTSNLLYKEARDKLYNSCEEKVSDIANELTDYLNKAVTVLWVTGDSVDQFLQKGIENKKIEDYIQKETEHQIAQFDENYIGFYAYVNGEYLDGLGWVPPEGYDIKSRDWYICAKEADGEAVIVPPYLDTYTGDIIISITKLLSDKENVVSLDVTLNHIQDIVSEIDINGNGYGMIIDKEGYIISHKDKSLNGHNCSEICGSNVILNAVKEVENGNTEVIIDGIRNTLFVNKVSDDWYTVVVVRNMDLLSDLHVKLIVNVCVYIIIFFLISFFYFMSYMNEQTASEKMEELITEKQKQEYESKVLKLEKSAADDANKAKSRFLADMSHEIRTPINAVLGMNEMIIRETESESIREYAGNIRSSGRALLSLINSILDFSKIEDGKMKIVPVEYSSVDMIHYLQTSIAERASAKSLSFIVDVDKTIPLMLYGDDMRLSQVIMNLLTNAVKYTKEGEVRLTFRNEGMDGDDIKLYVEVKDTGIGIRKEDMQKLFESFERLDVEKNRNIEGTGLGMAIVTKLLAMMGSELEVNSEYGVGSTFSFVIKQRVVDSHEIGDEFIKISEGAKAELGKAYHEAFHAPDGLILIVDDTKMNLNVAKNLLKKTLLKIDTALSGADALKLCLEKKYDLILMDQRMPGMDGTETLNAIRNQENGLNVDTPIVCLTADAISGARARYLAEGFSDYLTKPVEGYDLEKMVITYLPEEKIKRDAPSVKKEELPRETRSYFDSLKNSGIDVDSGMSYCQNDADVYKDILVEFAKEYKEKAENIKLALREENWKNYTVFVHSLKSTSKLIGAKTLSEKAAKLEVAGNASDSEYIINENDETMGLYKRIANLIFDVFKIDKEEKNDESEDDEILEFLPQ